MGHITIMAEPCPLKQLNAVNRSTWLRHGRGCLPHTPPRIETRGYAKPCGSRHNAPVRLHPERAACIPRVGMHPGASARQPIDRHAATPRRIRLAASVLRGNLFASEGA